MKKSVLIFAALAVCMMSFISITNFVATDFVATANAAGTVKIGVVDFQKILTTSTHGKRATDELNKKGKGMEDNMKAKENELLDLQKKFEKDSLVMSKEKKEEKQKELRTKFNEFKAMRSEFMREFKENQAVHLNKIQNSVMEITSEIGKKEGFSMILERAEGGIMYYDSAMDITDKVISEYNRRPATK
ncbi:MAG: OmpH family outer membrane protein [Desulfamplus sp.]|nr:OmpH family outer membrane protein [Desulfamplus sp.]